MIGLLRYQSGNLYGDFLHGNAASNGVGDLELTSRSYLNGILTPFSQIGAGEFCAKLVFRPVHVDQVGFGVGCGGE